MNVHADRLNGEEKLKRGVAGVRAQSTEVGKDTKGLGDALEMIETELPGRWDEFPEEKHRSGRALEIWKAERGVEVLFYQWLGDTEGDNVNSLGGLEAGVLSEWV